MYVPTPPQTGGKSGASIHIFNATHRHAKRGFSSVVSGCDAIFAVLKRKQAERSLFFVHMKPTSVLLGQSTILE
jgi:hypothetical protein